MNKKMMLQMGIIATPWWLITLAFFGYLEPNYSHLYKAVSELGAFGTENAVGMNILGFFATGCMVAATGVGFRQYLIDKAQSTSASWSIIILGIMLAGAAVPTDMDLYFQSPWTVIHAVFVTLAVVPFLVAAWRTRIVLAKLDIFSKFINYFPWLIIPTFFLYGVLAQRGLVQRLTIIIVLAWVSYLGWHLTSRKNG